MLTHVFFGWPFTQPGDDVATETVRQFAIKGFWTEETNGSLVGNGGAGIGSLRVVKRHVAPIGVRVVGDGSHFKRLCNDEFKIEKAATVNPLPPQHEGAVVEFGEVFKQLIANARHRRGVVGPTRSVLYGRTSIFDFRIKRFRIQRFFEKQLGEANTVGQHRGDDQRGEEDTGDHRQPSLFSVPSALSGQSKLARRLLDSVGQPSHG